MSEDISRVALGNLPPDDKAERFQLGIEALQERIGYRFKNKNLLVRAMTDRSIYINPHGSQHLHNKRLETVGDRIVNDEAKAWLNAHWPVQDKKDEDIWRERYFLQRLLNSNAYLAIFGAEIEIESALRIDVTEVYRQDILFVLRIKTWSQERIEEEYPGVRSPLDRGALFSSKPQDWQTRLRANAVEALVGAIAADSGEERARAFVRERLLPFENRAGRDDTSPVRGIAPLSQMDWVMRLLSRSLPALQQACSEVTRGAAELTWGANEDGSVQIRLALARYELDETLFMETNGEGVRYESVEVVETRTTTPEYGVGTAQDMLFKVLRYNNMWLLTGAAGEFGIHLPQAQQTIDIK